MSISEIILCVYYSVGIPLVFTCVIVETPKYITQAVFWPIWILIELVLSVIKWVKNIKL